MLRSLLCAAAVLSLVLSICLFPKTASARRCPVEEPETLLSLYQNSDAIYIAAFDKIVEGEIVETTEDFSVREIQKHFTISSTLKGQSRKFFVLNDRDYAYKTPSPEPQGDTSDAETAEPPEVAEEPEYADEEEESDSATFRSGDTFLLFVDDGDVDGAEENGEGEGPTLTDYREGIKKLTMDRIGVYEARIRELNSIFSSKNVSETAVLEWLIRCAEDPVTRWEGTYELLKSVETQERREQAAERLRERRLAHGESPEPEAEAEDPEDAKQGNFDTGMLPKMLDAHRKEALANIILNDHTSAAGKTGPVRGDRELIELVKRWGDPRFTGFLLDKLRAGSDDAESNAETMAMVSEILGDSDTAEIARRYEDTVYEDDDAAVAAETDGVEEVESVPAGEPEQDKTVDPPADEPREPAATEEPETEEPAIRKQTYKELRTELMRRFLAQSERVIAQKEREKEREQKPHADTTDK